MEDNKGSYQEYILDWEFVVDIRTTSRRYMKCRQDEDGAVYAWDEEEEFWWLVKVPNVEHYRIREEVLMIAKMALKACPRLKELEIPYGVITDLKEMADNFDHEVKITQWLWPYDCTRTEELQREIDEGRTDEQGFVYSQDGKRLLKAVSCQWYKIPEGVEHIEPSAFVGCKFEQLEFPYTCKESLEIVQHYSSQVTGHVVIHDKPYEDDLFCSEVLPGELTWEDDDHVVYSKDRRRLLYAKPEFDKEEYEVPDGVIIICDDAFSDVHLERPLKLYVPRSIQRIYNDIFPEDYGGWIQFKDSK